MASSSDRAAPTGFFTLRFPTLRRLVGNCGWPILQKELRANFRKSRFVITHTACLALVAVAIVWKVLSEQQGGNIESVRLGRSLFDWFFLLQFLIVLVVFPAFTATAFTEERTRKSFDLLICTDLTPTETVLGKLLATSVYCLTTVVATVPLVAITTLFGGVSFTEIVAAYAILIGLTCILASVGVFLSSAMSTNLRSTLSIYAIVCGLLAFVGYIYLETLTEWFSGGEADTLVTIFLRDFAGVLDVPARGAGEVLIDSMFNLAAFEVVVAGAVVFLYVFLATTNRIRPKSDDHASSLRLLTLCVLAGLLARSWYQVLYAPRETSDIVYGTLGLGSVILFGIALRFGTEPILVSRRLRRRFRSWRGVKLPLRLLVPGAFWGLAYTVVCAVGVAAALWYLGGIAAPHMTDFDSHRYFNLVLFLPFYVVAFAALGYCLSGWGFTQGYNTLTVFFIFVITALLPFVVNLSSPGDGLQRFQYLSPITVWHSLSQVEELRGPDEPRYVVLGDVPIASVAPWFFAAVAVVLFALGTRLARKAGIPLLAFPAREKDRNVAKSTTDTESAGGDDVDPDSTVREESRGQGASDGQAHPAPTGGE